MTISLVLIDIQREYIEKDRPFYLNGIENSLANCKQILAYARNNNWNIGHVNHSKTRANIFDSNSKFSDFIDGFQPMSDEKVFYKHIYSCYSNPEFADFMEENKLNGEIYIIGYNSIMCCLSTVIEGFHRGHQLHLVSDACYAKATANYSEQDMHKHSLDIIETAGFANLITTSELIGAMP